MEREMKEYEIINPNRDETVQAVKANYGRMSYANAVHTDTRKATFIMEREKILVNGTENGLPRAVRAPYGKTKTSAALCGYNSKPTLVMEQTGQQKALELAEAICSKLRGGRGFAAMEEDGTIRGQFQGERNSGISEAQYQYEDNVAQTLTTAHEPKCYGETTGWRIRKLTPVETGRLMGLEDTEIQKMIDAGIPKTQLYKLHGNSIVVDVLENIFRKMFIDTRNENRQLELF